MSDMSTLDWAILAWLAVLGAFPIAYAVALYLDNKGP